MASPSGRSRPTFEPNTPLFQRLLDQSGLSIVDYAHDINCGETTLRKLLSGERVAAETLKSIAEKLKRHWHDLLSAAEKTRIGINSTEGVTPVHPVQTRSQRSMPSLGTCLSQLPAMLTDFLGREKQVADLTDQLRGNKSGIRQPVLHGMGGVGKTSLAVRIAYAVKDQFPDGQLFIDLRGTADSAMANALTPAEAMTRVIHAFHPEAICLPKDEQELEGLYRSVLAGKRALIVLDNAMSEAQVRVLLTATPPTTFLLTSRTALALDGILALQINLLSRDEGYGLLRRIIGTKGSTGELNRIVHLCGYLPLAIRVAGDFLRLKEDWSVSRYIEALDHERLRWLRIGSDPSKDVGAVLKLSSVQFVRDSVDRATRWHLLHTFTGDFDVSAAAAAWDADENDDAVLDDLSEMKNRSLIIYDLKTARYHMHDLMRPIAEGLF